MPFGPAVYHPYLHITGEHWTSTAALYWDHLIRVTMRGVRLRDAESVRRLDEGLGLFEVREAAESGQEVSRAYLDLLHRGFEQQEPWAEEIVGRLPIERASAKTFRAFQTEQHEEIISTLKGLRLAQEFAGGWWGTTRRLLDAYMEICCAYVAEKTGAELLTDGITFDVSSSRVLAGRPAEGSGDRLSRLHVELPLVAPKSPGILDPKAVLMFRAECGEARRAYHEEIQSILDELDSAVSLNRIEETMRAHGNRLRSLLKTFRAALRHLGHKPMPCWLVVSRFPRSLDSGEDAPHERWIAPGLAVGRRSFAPGSRLSVERLKADQPRSWTLLLDRPLVARTACQQLRERLWF